jgi:hypothetical protein
MHATYTFIVDNEDPHDAEALADPEGAKGQFTSLTMAFDGQYGDDVCDSNNWYRVYGAVTKDGTLLGEPEFVASWTEKFPDASTRFEAAVRFAAGCVAVDMELFGGTRIALPGMEKTDEDRKLDALSTEEVIEAIYREAPAALAKAYGEFKPSVRGEFDMTSYRRAKLADQLEKFDAAGFKPFTDRGTPYEYRCFDIRNEGRGDEPCEDDVILFVDIHT